MVQVRFVAALAAVALAACGQRITVEQSPTQVLTTLASLPHEADAVDLATAFPGVDSYVNPAPHEVTWHFTLNGQEYGRFVASIDREGGKSTSVGTSFEQVQAGPYPAYLGRIAEIATQASVEAALEKRPVDRKAIQAAIGNELAKDPAVAQSIAMEMARRAMNEMSGP